jgi:hypothetical protein
MPLVRTRRAPDFAALNGTRQRSGAYRCAALRARMQKRFSETAGYRRDRARPMWRADCVSPAC